jgi:hypothetical protein
MPATTATRLRALRDGLREISYARQLADDLAGAVFDHIETNGRRPLVRDHLATALAAVLLSRSPPPP